MKRVLPLAGLILSIISTSLAATISVSSASDISNVNPSPGDTLLLSASADWADQDIIADFDGTANNPITLLAEGDGQVVLSGGATLQIAGAYVIVNGLTFKNCASTEGGDLVKFRLSSSNVATNCRLTNCFFSDNNPSDLDVGYKWVSLYGSNNRVDHCWFELKKHRGTTVVVWLTVDDDPNYHQIDHNYFTRPELSTGNNEAETIRIGDSKTSLVNSNTIVEYNYFEECDGEIESISNKSCYNVYRYNTFFNNHSILTLRHGHFCTVEGNYFFGNEVSGSGGVRIIGYGHKIIGNYMQDLRSSGNLRAPIVIMGGLESVGINDATNRYVAAEDNIVAYNTIVNCDGDAIYIGSDKTDSGNGEVYKAPSNNTIENNIIYGSSGNVLEFEKGEIASFNYSGNIYNGVSLGKSSGDGFTNVDPDFTFGSGLYPAKINNASPAIDAALPSVFTSTYTSYNEPIDDIDGQQRSGVNDVGCDEYSTAAVNREPVQKLEVGPCWMNPEACDADYVFVDCHGDENGDAFYDNCGICSEGNTGVTANENCEQDCSGTWGGTAAEDACGVCSGGNTGIEIDACLSCETVTASPDDGNGPENTLDNDLDTRWSSQGDGAYIEYCLGEVVSLAGIDIAFLKGDERTTSFDVLVSTDGVNYTTVLSGIVSSGLTLDLEEYDFDAPVEAWKLKIIGHGNSSNDWNSITEVVWREATVTNTEELLSKMNLAPNPTAGDVMFAFDDEIETITVVNTLGQIQSLSYSKHGELVNLSIPDDLNGVLTLSILTVEGDLITSQIIKK